MAFLRADRPRLTREMADEIGLEALLFLVQDTQRVSDFMAATGIAPDELRRRAHDTSLHVAALEYVLQDESALLVFAAHAGRPPEFVQPALALLSPGSVL